MKALLAILTMVFVFEANASLLVSKPIYCRIQGDNGRWMLTIKKMRNGNFAVNDVDAGQNLSNDPTRLQLDTRPLIGFLSCRGAAADIDLLSGKGVAGYKYDSGILGGGCQNMKGQVSLCNNEAWPQ